jgi:pSer/pThr/pTyr-binding forkhead associated (FHA) protein
MDNYKSPSTASIPNSQTIQLEIIKEGVPLATLKPEFSSTFIVLGRLPSCDIELQHPSVSRNHCIIQFMDNQFYLYDLGSVHGTFVNKKRIDPKQYIELYNGDMIRFAESSRLYICQNIQQRPIDESQVYVPQSIHKPLLKSLPKQIPVIPNVQKMKPAMNTDIIQSMDFIEQEEINSSTQLDDHFYNDPKNALKNWLQNHQYPSDFRFKYKHDYIDEDNQGMIVTLELTDPPLMATGSAKGKRNAEKAACLNACEQLVHMGLLVSNRPKENESEKRIKRNEMFGDAEDGDDLLDRTTRPTKKMKKVETFESLSMRKQEILNEIKIIKERMHQIENNTGALDEHEKEEDELESYMKRLEKTRDEKTSSHVLQKRIPGLELELKRVDQLLMIVAPSTSFKEPFTVEKTTESTFKPPFTVEKTTESTFKEPMSVEKTTESTFKEPLAIKKTTESTFKQPFTVEKTADSTFKQPLAVKKSIPKPNDSEITSDVKNMNEKKNDLHIAKTRMPMMAPMHYQQETEDVEIAPDMNRNVDVADMNASYGY